MKRMFIAAMAIAALVSCSNEKDDTILTSSKKSVSISIANAVSSRAATLVEATDADDVEAVGSEGQLLTAGTAVVSAELDDMTFLFANDNGEIVQIKSAADSSTPEGVNDAEEYTLTFHNITEAATQIAVVRYGDMQPLDIVGDNLETVRNEAANEAENAEVELDQITLYGSSLLTANGTCTGEDGHVYNLYTAKVDLAPLFARVEITYVECTDLGEATYNMATDTTVDPAAVKGYDEVTLKDIKFGADKYTYSFAANTILKGKYDPTVAEDPVRANYTATRKYAFDATGAKNLAWNIAQQPAFSDETPLTMSVATHAYDYSNATKNTTLTVVGLTGEDGAVSTFEAGNIYRLDLDFKEANLDNYGDGICVNVEVTVAKWVVNIVEPTFKTNPATSEE